MTTLASITVLYPRWKMFTNSKLSSITGHYKRYASTTTSQGTPRAHSYVEGGRRTPSRSKSKSKAAEYKDKIDRTASHMDLDLKIAATKPQSYNTWLAYITQGNNINIQITTSTISKSKSKRQLQVAVAKEKQHSDHEHDHDSININAPNTPQKQEVESPSENDHHDHDVGSRHGNDTNKVSTILEDATSLDVPNSKNKGGKHSGKHSRSNSIDKSKSVTNSNFNIDINLQLSDNENENENEKELEVNGIGNDQENNLSPVDVDFGVVDDVDGTELRQESIIINGDDDYDSGNNINCTGNNSGNASKEASPRLTVDDSKQKHSRNNSTSTTVTLTSIRENLRDRARSRTHSRNNSMSETSKINNFDTFAAHLVRYVPIA